MKSWKAWMCRFLTRKYPCCSVWFSSRGQYCPHLTRPRSTTLGQEEGVRLGSPSSPPSHKTCGCQESHLVVMTMSSTICSQTSRQKSSKVLGKGPASQETTFRFLSCLIQVVYSPCVHFKSAVQTDQCTIFACLLRGILGKHEYLLTLSGNVGIASLVPVHEASVDVVCRLHEAQHLS